MADYPDIDVSDAEWIDEDNFHPRYNIAPRSNAPVIRRQSPEDSNLVIHTMKWGVVPHWSKHEDLTLNTINARAENLVESSGMWTGMKRDKRCVVVCDGYFEWLKKGKERLPHFTRRKDGKFMILAGLYDSVLLEGAEVPLWTFTIVTTDAAPSFSWLHDRQPVILSSTVDFEAWLDTSKGWHAGLVELLRPRDGAELECFPVPKERKDGIEAMFAKQAAKGRQVNTGSSSNETPSSSSTLTRPSSYPTSTNVMDGKAPKRAIEIDSSPSLSRSPSPGQSSTKRQKLSHSREGKTKRSMEGDAESSPTKKRQKIAGTIEGEAEATSGKPVAQSKLRAKSGAKASSPSPHKTPRSKRSLEDPGSDKTKKITAFFPVSDSRTARGSPPV